MSGHEDAEFLCLFLPVISPCVLNKQPDRCELAGAGVVKDGSRKEDDVERKTNCKYPITRPTPHALRNVLSGRPRKGGRGDPRHARSWAEGGEAKGCEYFVVRKKRSAC